MPYEFLLNILLLTSFPDDFRKLIPVYPLQAVLFHILLLSDPINPMPSRFLFTILLLTSFLDEYSKLKPLFPFSQAVLFHILLLYEKNNSTPLSWFLNTKLSIMLFPLLKTNLTPRLFSNTLLFSILHPSTLAKLMPSNPPLTLNPEKTTLFAIILTTSLLLLRASIVTFPDAFRMSGLPITTFSR